jgi:WD40 repeat protein
LALHEAAALAVAFSPDGRTLASSHADGAVVLWDVRSQQPIGWEVDPAAWRRHACAVVGRGLTPEQWDEIVPEQDYISVCPSR